MTDRRTSLSPEGTRRHAAILELANQALQERGRRRRTRRAGSAALVLGAVAVSISLLRSESVPRGHLPQVVATRVQLMSDEDLARELKSIGIDAGVARFNGEVHVIASDGKRFEPPLRWSGIIKKEG